MQKRVFWKTYLATQAQQKLNRQQERMKTTVIVHVRRSIPLLKHTSV